MSTPFSSKLKVLLEQDLINLKQLTEVLEAESLAFSQSDNAALQPILASKNGLLSSIEQRAKLKARLMAESGLGIRPGQVQNILLSIPDAKLHALWDEVNLHLHHCKERNEVNGKIVAHSLSRVNKMMSILRGQQNAPSLYASSGSRTSLNTSRSIAQA